MPRVNIGDKTGKILKGILHTHGLSGTSVAKVSKRNVATVTYQIRNAERMSIENFRVFINAADMTDDEIVKVVRG